MIKNLYVKNVSKLVSAILVAAILLMLPLQSNAYMLIESLKSYKDYEQIDQDKMAAVEYVTKNKFMEGFEQQFMPKKILTRGEMAKILVKNLNVAVLDEELYSSSPSFSDMQNHWAEPFVETLVSFETGILSGYPDGTFKPDQPLRRDELAKILITAYNNMTGFPEREVSGLMDIDTWAKPYIEVIVNLGVDIGDGQSLFMPEEKVTRELAAQWIYRLYTGYGMIEPRNNPFVTVPYDLSVEFYAGAFDTVYKFGYEEGITYEELAFQSSEHIVTYYDQNGKYMYPLPFERVSEARYLVIDYGYGVQRGYELVPYSAMQPTNVTIDLHQTPDIFTIFTYLGSLFNQTSTYERDLKLFDMKGNEIAIQNIYIHTYLQAALKQAKTAKYTANGYVYELNLTVK